MAEESTLIGSRTCGADTGRPQSRAIRHDGWTEARRRAFLAHLALTANVTASADAAGMKKTSAGRLRRRSAAFRAQWDAALDEGYRNLEEQLLARAIAGTEIADPPADADPRRIEQSNKLALTLLARHFERVALIRAHRAEIRDGDTILEEIKAKLTTIRERIGRDA